MAGRASIVGDVTMLACAWMLDVAATNGNCFLKPRKDVQHSSGEVDLMCVNRGDKEIQAGL
jgi:hypothetical protein